MSNSDFEKTIENVRKHKLVTTENKKKQKNHKKTFFSKHSLAVEMKKRNTNFIE